MNAASPRSPGSCSLRSSPCTRGFVAWALAAIALGGAAAAAAQATAEVAPAPPALAAPASRTADGLDGAGCPPVAPTLTPERVQAGMRDARDHGFLWRIGKDGRTSYLYGTLHVARFDWMFPGPTILEAMRESDTVALELDLLDAEMQSRLAAQMTQRRNATPLPPALARRVAARIAAECVDTVAFAQFVPELQIAMLTTLAARRDGFDPAYAIDVVIAGFARSLQKTVVSLETPELQLAALRMTTPEETAAFVASGLDDLESGRVRPLLNRIAQVWTDADYAQLARYESWCDCLRTPAEQAALKRLLDDRNPALAEKIDALHAAGQQVFAAVGSLHMVGPAGLPTLLRQRGYKVEQGDFGR